MSWDRYREGIEKARADYSVSNGMVICKRMHALMINMEFLTSKQLKRNMTFTTELFILMTAGKDTLEKHRGTYGKYY